MKTLKIYDPAKSGALADTESVPFADFLKNLDACRVKVERFNLSQEPAEYAKEPVAAILKEKGSSALPFVMIDDEVISIGEYPDLGKLSDLLGTTKISFELPDCTGCRGCD